MLAFSLNLDKIFLSMLNFILTFVFLIRPTEPSASTPFVTPERVIRIEIPYHDVVYQLQDKVDLAIIDAQDHFITAYADDRKIQEIEALGYKVTILIPDYQQELAKILQGYHSYAQVCSIMTALSQTYPSITKLETLGFSVLARPILAMKVTDNPWFEEPEPEIRLVGAHHGNEKISTEITLAFLQYLVENYASNPQVQYLVDNREIWVIPIFNVDGHIANRRTNNNGVDLNRDYGYMWSGEGSSPSPFSQPETKAMRLHSEANNITLEYEYHSTASYVNYLWDHHPQDPPDSGLIINISQRYADSTYGSQTTQLVKINGYDWYYVRGSAQDALFGIWGGIGTTIETQQPSQQGRIDSICIANRRALLAMITLAGYGIEGTVRDSITSEPLFALVQFTDPLRWSVYTDKNCGDFHKMVAPGAYTVKVSAQGYATKIVENVVVPAQGSVNLEIFLTPSNSIDNYIQKLVWVRRDRPDVAYRTITNACLGEPDGIPYSLGVGGTIVLEAFPAIKNLPGFDFTVFESDTAPESYTVYVSNVWDGTWYLCGVGLGTTSFDLSTPSLDSARYIKIVDAGGGSTSDPYAGFDLDAVSYKSERTAIAHTPNTSLLNSNLMLYPNPTSSNLTISYQSIANGNFTLKLYSVTGKLVTSINLTEKRPGEYQNSWNLKDKSGKRVPAGIYLGILETGTIKQRGKAPLNPQKDFFLKTGELRGFPSTKNKIIVSR
uniref:T9SS type A sorting domain-containing protein n=1 Tax=candidate division WOR-3 bacterium TaxID=2052148 RepID=A0A7C6AA00_UNCW3